MANCLQFNKEIQTNPGNSGVCKTRAMVCELLAIKLLKEFTTRELVSLISMVGVLLPMVHLLTNPRLVCVLS